LQQGDAYAWWVRSVSASGATSAWSGEDDFTVAPLAAPAPAGPAGLITATTPTFGWSAVAGADHYDVWLTDKTTGVVTRNQFVTATTWMPGGPLRQGDSYAWWVRSVSPSGATSAWSGEDDFTVAPLAAPAPAGPAGLTAGLTPTFGWAPVAGADHYDIWLTDKTTGVVTRNQFVTATTWMPGGPLRQGDAYAWWVRSVSASGATSAWSGEQDFSVIP
jgi:hypothetical protein